jgi:hypothetical protein
LTISTAQTSELDYPTRTSFTGVSIATFFSSNIEDTVRLKANQAKEVCSVMPRPHSHTCNHDQISILRESSHLAAPWAVLSPFTWPHNFPSA